MISSDVDIFFLSCGSVCNVQSKKLGFPGCAAEIVCVSEILVLMYTELNSLDCECCVP